MKLFLSNNISWYKWRYDLNTANKLPLELSLECIFQKEKKEILIYECTFWNNGNFEFSFMKGQSFKIYCINKKVYWHCCSVVSFDYTYPVYYILKLRTIENYNLFLTSSAAISFSLRLLRSTIHNYKAILQYITYLILFILDPFLF